MRVDHIDRDIFCRLTDTQDGVRVDIYGYARGSGGSAMEKLLKREIIDMPFHLVINAAHDLMSRVLEETRCT